MSILLTHATQYCGPGCVPVLLREHAQLWAHDPSFVDQDRARAFEAAHPGAVALGARDAPGLLALLAERGLRPQCVVHNDVHPNHPLPIENIPLAHWQASLQDLLLFPIQLSQALLPAMREAGQGRFVFVTSARYRRPEAGFAVATTVRAASTQFALALAREVAGSGIQVNVVAPNYLYSEAYYPRARYIDDPVGAAEIARLVPLGRLGHPEEVGELIAFLISGRSGFVTGQVIDFSGGWP